MGAYRSADLRWLARRPGLRQVQSPRRSGYASDTENLLLLGLELLFGEQALVLHHREFLDLHQLVIQAARGRPCGGLCCSRLLLRQGLLLRSELSLL